MAVTFGVYDPSAAFTSKSGIGLDHYIVLDWNKPLTDIGNGAGSLSDLCTASHNAGRLPLVTVFPFSDSRITRNPGNLLADVASGKYDAPIRDLAAALKIYNGPFYLRWGPGMDDPSNYLYRRYDWAVPPAQAPDYIAAYIRFVDVFRSYSNGLSGKKFLWSPVTGMRSEPYFPGNSFVDLVGCSMYVWARYVSIMYSGGQTDYTFANLFGQRYPRLTPYGKPIIIAEMGFERADDQASWVAGMKASLATFPSLSAAVWSNLRYVYPVVPGGPLPNYTIDPALWHNP